MGRILGVFNRGRKNKNDKSRASALCRKCFSLSELMIRFKRTRREQRKKEKNVKPQSLKYRGSCMRIDASPPTAQAKIIIRVLLSLITVVVHYPNLLCIKDNP